MMTRIYSMFDRKSRAYGALLGFVNDEVARRAVLSIVRGDQGDVHLFPGDFDLFLVGEQDSETGMITPSLPALVFNCGDLVKAQEN